VVEALNDTNSKSAHLKIRGMRHAICNPLFLFVLEIAAILLRYPPLHPDDENCEICDQVLLV